MKRSKRLVAILMVMVMVLSIQMSAFAEEPVQQLQQPVELPSAWAMEGAEWSAIYGLVPQEMFSKYTSNINHEELNSVCVNLYEKLTGEAIKPAANLLNQAENLELQKEATRFEVVAGIYNTIKTAQPDFDLHSDIDLTYNDAESIPENSVDIVKYAVSKELLKGRSNNMLQLNAPCTRQELMIFLKKAYEFSIYEADKDSKGVFWKVSDEDSTVYVVGSVHVANPSMYPLSKQMLKAFEESDALVVEADIYHQQEGIQYMQQKMMYADDNTLDKNIPKELYDRFVEIVSPLGIPAEMYNKFKPWYAAMLAQSLQISQTSYNANLGIDLFFTSKASGLKDIIEVEGIKFQVDMFDSFSNELQLQFLAGVINSDSKAQEDQVKALDSMVGAWKKGDCSELAKLLETEEDNSAEAKEFNEKMWTTRNANMTEKVKTYLADPEKKTYFVVVGAGHVVGEDGIVSQLDDEFKTEQIK